ncbi:MAG: L-dopachrome tautomerase-related protein [Bacteroidota bacterium]
MMKKILIWVLATVFALLVILAIYLRLNFGGGKDYIDISTKPKYDSEDLELVLSYEEPIGNVAASKDTSGSQRVFFTVHPESRPQSHKLLEIVDGKAVPYPNATTQDVLFTSVLGVFTDYQNRLWTIDHGNHGTADVKLIAFDLSTNQVIHEYVFPKEVAETLSFFNDLSVTPDGRYVFVADVSFFGRKPSLVVYDIQSGKSRSLLDDHPSVDHQKYVPTTPNKKMRFFGGIVDLLTGIDGLDVSKDGAFIYWAPMGHADLFKLSIDMASDFNLSDEAIAAAVTRVASKPLSDGIRCDTSGNVYITDIENQGIYVIAPNGEGFTLIKDERIRWADGLSLGMDGYFYLADSDIPNQMLQSKKHIAKHAPYNIFRFKSL